MEEKDGDEVKKEKEKGMTKRRNGVEEQEKRRRKKKEEGRGEEEGEARPVFPSRQDSHLRSSFSQRFSNSCTNAT